MGTVTTDKWAELRKMGTGRKSYKGMPVEREFRWALEIGHGKGHEALLPASRLLLPAVLRWISPRSLPFKLRSRQRCSDESMRGQCEGRFGSAGTRLQLKRTTTQSTDAYHIDRRDAACTMRERMEGECKRDKGDMAEVTRQPCAALGRNRHPWQILPETRASRLA
jgi:hypothetical protein